MTRTGGSGARYFFFALAFLGFCGSGKPSSLRMARKNHELSRTPASAAAYRARRRISFPSSTGKYRFSRCRSSSLMPSSITPKVLIYKLSLLYL